MDTIILLNAMIPKPGETGNDWWADTGQGEAQRRYLNELGIDPATADDDDVVYFHDVPGAVKEETYGRGEPAQTMTPMEQRWPPEAWPRCADPRDRRSQRPAVSRRVPEAGGDGAARLEAEELEGGHLLALSRPRELAEKLLG